MLIYLLVFLLTILLTRVIAHTSNSIVKKVSICLVILLPSALAGFRDAGIGTDTNVYIEPTIREMTYYANKSFIEFFQSYKTDEISNELIYSLLVLLVVKLGGEENAVYFTLNLIVMIFVFKSIYDNRHRASMPLMMLMFLFSYYNLSLNIMRQFLAMSMCLYTNKYVENQQWLKVLLCYILIIYMHNSGLFYLVYIAFSFVFNKASINMKSINKIILLLIIIILPVFFSLMDIFIAYFISIGILPERFISYTSNEADSMVIRSGLIIGWIIILLLIYFYRKLKIKSTLLQYTIYLKFAYVQLFLASIFSKWAFRISFYFGLIVDILFIPIFINVIEHKNKRLGQVLKFSVSCIVIFYWYWSIVYRNGGETVPYTSKILGI